MKGLYLLLDIGTFFFPFILSFDKKVAYVKQWRSVFFAGLIVAVPFLIWDFSFTQAGVWGFNPDYLCGIYLLNLPIEEVLFFVVVPFSCVFIYACCKAYFHNFQLKKLNVTIYVLLVLYIGFIAFYGYQGAYAQSVIISTPITLGLVWLLRSKLTFLPLAFLIILIPFLAVNGVLTGSFTTEPVVWYNDAERTPFRIFTIPVEDVLYGFTLVGLNVGVFEFLKRSSS